MRRLRGFIIIIIGVIGIIGSILYAYTMIGWAVYYCSWTCSSTTYLSAAVTGLLPLIFGISFYYFAKHGFNLLKP
jgi:hypothetical protein